ncbi:MAG: response regulator transcription factor [Thermoleophilaceae bacterium]
MKAGQAVRLLVVDDHPIVRRGLRLLLDAQPDLEVVAEAGDGVEAVECGLQENVDLAILDVTMPRLSGLEAARQLREQRPALRMLILSMHADDHYCLEAYRAGASGYILKSAVDRDLVRACRDASGNTGFICPESARKLIEQHGASDVGRTRNPGGLTARETEVLKLVAYGHTTQEIAAKLVISQKTVERHRGSLLDKLEMRDRVDLTRYAIRRGLIQA